MHFIKNISQTVYAKWLQYRLRKSQESKRFSDYFDIFVLGECESCNRDERKCNIYAKLGPQRLEVRPDWEFKVTENTNSILLKFVSGKKDVYRFTGELDPDRKSHYTQFKLYVISRRNRKVFKTTINGTQAQPHTRTQRILLSKRQRKEIGKIMWNDESKFLQPDNSGKQRSVIGHSYARNTYNYNRQSKYESRVNKSTSLINMCDIHVEEVHLMFYDIDLKAIYDLEKQHFDS